ncbi:MAG TPA: hypothetical protein VNE39_11835 [Planctomycetota bacterium]|nr:hypothetical protein [Planctomycetota bacterium]
MLARGGIILALLACLAGAEERKERGLTRDEIKAGEFTLRSKRLAATLMVPGQPSSAYAGQRFESGGVVLQVTLDGRHTFLGKEPRGERLGGFGLIEEMGISQAVGYDEARPGEPFLKLGVGLLKRGKEPKYSFYPPCPEVERFPWEVTVMAREATFVQVGRPFRGMAYRYEKRIALDAAEPILRIEHALASTGEKPIATDQYCHDFFTFDGAAPGPDYVVTTGFPLEAELEAKAPMVVAGKALTFNAMVKGGTYARFRGAPNTQGEQFRIRNKANGLEVAVAGDFPVSTFAYYADQLAASPEAYCAVTVKPGETFRWTRTYTFK